MSWIEEEEEILHIENNPKKEKMTRIRCYYIYINMNHYIDKIDMEEIEISSREPTVPKSGDKSPDSTSCLETSVSRQLPLDEPSLSIKQILENNESKNDSITKIESEKVLQIIQSKKIYTPNTKYILKDTFMFLVDLDPEHIQDFINYEGELTNYANNFLKKVDITSDIKIQPSIPAFHKINGIYFFFEEKLKTKPGELRSILKTSQKCETKKQLENPKKSKPKKRVTLRGTVGSPVRPLP